MMTFGNKIWKHGGIVRFVVQYIGNSSEFLVSDPGPYIIHDWVYEGCYYYGHSSFHVIYVPFRMALVRYHQKQAPSPSASVLCALRITPQQQQLLSRRTCTHDVTGSRSIPQSIQWLLLEFNGTWSRSMHTHTNTAARSVSGRWRKRVAAMIALDCCHEVSRYAVLQCHTATSGREYPILVLCVMLFVQSSIYSTTEEDTTPDRCLRYETISPGHLFALFFSRSSAMYRLLAYGSTQQAYKHT